MAAKFKIEQWVEGGGTRSHDEWLLERLRDPHEAGVFLEEFLIDDGQDDHDFIAAHGIVKIIRAHGLSSLVAQGLAEADDC